MNTARRGQSTVELALVLPLLMLIVLGIVDFGRVFVASTALTHATAAGARYGSLNAADLPGIRSRVEDDARRAGASVSDANVDICYLDSSGTQLACSTGGGAMTPATSTLPGDLVQVRVHLPWSAETTIIQNVMPSGFNLNSTAAATVEQ